MTYSLSGHLPEETEESQVKSLTEMLVSGRDSNTVLHELNYRSL
jgi:hypothetical protein